MYRASTPTHFFKIPVDAEMIQDIKLTYAQAGKPVLNKTKEDLTLEDGWWKITLTQEEANLFAEAFATAQLRVLTTGGQCFPSAPVRLFVHGVLDDEVMV